MYETLMAHWHIPFDHIEDHWTDAEFNLMYLCLIDRLKEQEEQERRSYSNASSGHPSPSPSSRTLTEKDLLRNKRLKSG